MSGFFGFFIQYLPDLRTIDVRAGETADVRVVLRRPVEISGVVVDESGRPIPDLSVNAVEVPPPIATSRTPPGTRNASRATCGAGIAPSTPSAGATCFATLP